MPAERVSALEELARTSPYWDKKDDPALQMRHDMMRAKISGFLERPDTVYRRYPLSNTGLLSRFVGMLTDSRSFLSYPRHEYFRRVLCNLIGRDVENGELPDSEDLLGPMVRDICYANARRFLRLDQTE